MVGCFVKTVALRTIVPPHASFRQVVRAVHQTVAEAHDHQTVPFERVVDAVGARRRLDVHPIYQTFFGFLGGREIRLGGAEINPIKLLDYDSAKWDMALSLWEDAGRIDGILECSADLVDPDTVTRFRDVFLTLCERLVAEPDAPVAVHPLVNDLERDRILLRLNDFEPTTIADATLAEPFVRQARRTPDAVAVEAGSRTLTYRELNEWANRLAHTLRELGAIRGEQVALLMDRSLECLVTVYAVAKSGATYVPLEPDLPDARLRFMLADIAPKLVVGQGVPEAISFAELDALAAGRPVLDPVNHGGGDNRSHLLYTSGSTGRPKAVACPVRTAVADILDIQGRLAYRPDDVILFKTSYGFDTSLWELFWPLYVGAKVVICPPGAEKDPDRLIEVIERHRVTVVDLTPTHLQAVLEAMRPGRCATLRYLHTGGERVTARLRDEVHAVFGDTVLINGYGPTETACVASTPLRRETGRTVPVGRPHRHVRIYVLDDQLNVQPIGVPGEAYVGSPVGITHGYHNRPELTAQRYLPDPFGPPGSRMYRTGDICRYLPDGMLEVLGRADSQVKIRGLRVELQEVEAVLLDHRDVAECAVLTIGDGIDRSLAAFVRPRAGATLDPAALHEHAARSLPPHMVPGGIQVIARIPMTVNGKTDRQALLAGWRTTPATARRAAAEPPATDLERQLAAIFAEVLVLPEVGVTDSFFELGGHSLRVFKLIAACETRLRLRPRVADVFAAPTVRDLADRLSSAPAPEPTCLVPLRPRPGRPLVVFVHASSGSALPFGDVASELGDDFSSYAMQSPEDGQFTVPRLAAIYVAEVDKVRGLSPVVIAGWSMGGCVAVEMARIWQERGIEVAAVAMLDTWPPPTTHADPERRARSRAAVLGLDVIAAEGLDVALGDRAAGELNRLRATIERNRTAFLDYTPAPFHGLVHLLRAAEQADKAFAALHPSEDYGWGELISEVVACELPGSHFSLLRKENARHLAVAIRAAFDSGTAYGEL
jgi:amino acid adenylation domain-containing protein